MTFFKINIPERSFFIPDRHKKKQAYMIQLSSGINALLRLDNDKIDRKEGFIMGKSCTNKFAEEEVKSEYLREWLNLLCNTEKRYKKFMDHFIDNGHLFHSACQYQRYLRDEEGRGREIQVNHIQSAMDKGDLSALNNVIEELFIEPIDREAIKHFVRVMEKDDVELHDFINLYKSDRDRGFWLTVKKLM